jgi:hypothetical protein
MLLFRRERRPLEGAEKVDARAFSEGAQGFSPANNLQLRAGFSPESLPFQPQLPFFSTLRHPGAPQ